MSNVQDRAGGTSLLSLIQQETPMVTNESVKFNLEVEVIKHPNVNLFT